MNYDNIYEPFKKMEAENYETDYPWIELNINGTKYDINSKYLYGTPYNEST